MSGLDNDSLLISIRWSYGRGPQVHDESHELRRAAGLSANRRATKVLPSALSGAERHQKSIFIFLEREAKRAARNCTSQYPQRLLNETRLGQTAWQKRSDS
jgi:hypothetical protein